MKRNKYPVGISGTLGAILLTIMYTISSSNLPRFIVGLILLLMIVIIGSYYIVIYYDKHKMPEEPPKTKEVIHREIAQKFKEYDDQRKDQLKRTNDLIEMSKMDLEIGKHAREWASPENREHWDRVIEIGELFIEHLRQEAERIRKFGTL